MTRFKIALTVLTAITSLMLVFFLSANLASKANDLDHTWQQQSNFNVEESRHIKSIVTGFGYGGFIHHFKNMVLRRDLAYAYVADDKLAQTEYAIKSLQLLGISHELRQQTQELALTVSEYRTKFELAQKLITKNLSAEEIDKKVRVDDTAALAAVDHLLIDMERRAKEFHSVSRINLNSFQQTIKNSFIAIAVVLLISFAFILFNLILLTIKFTELDIIFTGAPIGMMNVSHKGFITKANNKMMDLFGFSKSHLPHLNVDQLVPDEIKDKHAGYREDFQKSKRMIPMNQRHSNFYGKRLDGGTFPIGITIASYFAMGKKSNIVLVKDLSLEHDLDMQAKTDSLTKLANRRSGDDELMKAMHHASRYSRPLSLILCDIDLFKSINDSFGHDEGDAVLKKVAEIMVKNSRTVDFVCRWGGEEFITIASGLTMMEAEQFAEKIRIAIQLGLADSKSPVTASFGVTEFRPEDDDKQSFFKRTDDALYQSKKSGRNKVTVV